MFPYIYIHIHGWRYKVYFARELVTKAEFDAVTYEGGEAIMRKLSVSCIHPFLLITTTTCMRVTPQVDLWEMYDEHRNDYYDHIRAWRKKAGDTSTTFPVWPSFADWLSRAEAPTGGTFRKHAEPSPYHARSTHTYT